MANITGTQEAPFLGIYMGNTIGALQSPIVNMSTLGSTLQTCNVQNGVEAGNADDIAYQGSTNIPCGITPYVSSIFSQYYPPCMFDKNGDLNSDYSCSFIANAYGTGNQFKGIEFNPIEGQHYKYGETFKYPLCVPGVNNPPCQNVTTGTNPPNCPKYNVNFNCTQNPSEPTQGFFVGPDTVTFDSVQKIAMCDAQEQQTATCAMYNVYPSTSGGPNVSGFPQCPYNFPYSYPCVLNVPNGTLDPVIMAIKSACTTEINQMSSYNSYTTSTRSLILSCGLGGFMDFMRSIPSGENGQVIYVGNTLNIAPAVSVFMPPQRTQPLTINDKIISELQQGIIGIATVWDPTVALLTAFAIIDITGKVYSDNTELASFIAEEIALFYPQYDLESVKDITKAQQTAINKFLETIQGGIPVTYQTFSGTLSGTNVNNEIGQVKIGINIGSQYTFGNTSFTLCGFTIGQTGYDEIFYDIGDQLQLIGFRKISMTITQNNTVQNVTTYDLLFGYQYDYQDVMTTSSGNNKAIALSTFLNNIYYRPIIPSQFQSFYSAYYAMIQQQAPYLLNNVSATVFAQFFVPFVYYFLQHSSKGLNQTQSNDLSFVQAGLAVVLAGGQAFPVNFNMNIDNMSDKSDLESNLDLNFTFTYMSDGMTTMFGGSIPTFGGPVFDALMASFCSVKGGIQGAIACSCLNTTLATPICTDFSCQSDGYRTETIIKQIQANVCEGTTYNICQQNFNYLTGMNGLTINNGPTVASCNQKVTTVAASGLAYPTISQEQQSSQLKIPTGTDPNSAQNQLDSQGGDTSPAKPSSSKKSSTPASPASQSEDGSSTTDMMIIIIIIVVIAVTVIIIVVMLKKKNAKFQGYVYEANLSNNFLN